MVSITVGRVGNSLDIKRDGNARGQSIYSLSLKLNHFETAFQFFIACPVTLHIWKELKKWLSLETRLPPLTPQNAILGIVEHESYEADDIKLINHILLTFKHSPYNRRDAPTPPNFFYVRERLKLEQKIEYKIAKDINTLVLHLKKWEKIIPNKTTQ